MSATTAHAIAKEVFPQAVLKQATLWENATKETILTCIQLLALHYSFDVNEATRHIQLDEMKIVYKKSAKAPREKKEKVIKEKVIKEKKQLIPLPFFKHCVSTTACQGLNFNRGLFTQCENMPLEEDKYCAKCASEAAQSSNNVPKCGSILDRLNADLYDFVDPSGRKPTHFLKVINKLKISVEQVEAHMETKNLTFDETHICHIVVPEQPAKKKGGKKAKTAVVAVDAEEVVDMFSQMPVITSQNMSVAIDDDSIMPQIVSEKDVKDAKKAEKAEKKALKEAKKAEKAEKTALKEAKKDKKSVVDKEAEKEAKKALKEAEKEAKKALKEAEKEAKKANKKKAKKEIVAVDESNVQKEEEEIVNNELQEEEIVEEEEEAQIADLDDLDLDDLDLDEEEEEESSVIKPDDDAPDAVEFECNGQTFLVEADHVNDDVFDLYNVETSEKVGFYTRSTGVATLEEDEY
jgi:hypothetical protein